MSHPYKSIVGLNEHHRKQVNHQIQRKIQLSAVEEHYLKKMIIKQQLEAEINSLSPEYNDRSGLRRFGPPFVPADPKLLLNDSDTSTLEQIYAMSELSIDVFRQQFPLLRFIFDNFIVTFPFIKIHLSKMGNTYLEQSKFWLKIQMLFELFKSKKISNSNDRGSTSKRSMIVRKFQGLFLSLFNSAIYCKQDAEYFQMDKERRGASKKLSKFTGSEETEESSKDKELKTFIELENDMKDSSYLLEKSVSTSTLLDHIDEINDDDYINGYYINIIGVSVESETKSTFWGAKEGKYYTFIIHIKLPNEKGYFIKRRYSDFEQLYKDLKTNHPGIKIPELPSKDKHNVEMSKGTNIDSNSKLDNEEYKNLHELDSEFADMDKESLDELFQNSFNNNVPKIVEPLSPPPTKSIFGKPNKLKSPLGSPILSSPRKSSGKKENSFLSNFKKPWTGSNGSNGGTLTPGSPMSVSSSSSSMSHKRNGSFGSTNSIDSIDTADSNDTYYSANASANSSNTDEKMVFPREILRQSLRGFLKYTLFIKTCSESKEIKKFFQDDKIELTTKEIHDIQHRINFDHLRKLQHYKFQNALSNIVTVLEKDVEQLKIEIYNEGFGYIFDRIKKYNTLRELCGYDYERGNGTWLERAYETNATVDNTDDIEIDKSYKPLRGLIRVILLEIASTQYEMLIGNDSAMSTLKTVKKLHSIFPYRIIAGVLRFTNPLMMVKRMIDIFTYQMPTMSGMTGGSVNAISNGLSGMMQGLGLKKKLGREDLVENIPNSSSSTNKGKSLLQMIFSSMIGDDLRKLEKEIIEVSDLLKSFNDNDESSYGNGELIIQRIDEYFKSDDDVVLGIKKISTTCGIDLPMSILMPNNGLKSEELNIKFVEKLLNECQNDKEIDDVTMYKLGKRYFFTQLRKYDKESLIELWEEPELVEVIKEVIAMFLSPLIEVFKKAEVYKYVPIFAHYMSELIEICETYGYDYGTFTRSDIVGSLVKLEEKYSEDVYKFLRDIYTNDTNGQLFEGIIEWLNKITQVLKNGKRGEVIDVVKIINGSEISVEDKRNILHNIQLAVTKSEKKKKALEKAEKEGGEKNDEVKGNIENIDNDWLKMGRDRAIDKRWDEIHNRVFDVGAAVAGDCDDIGDGLSENEDDYSDTASEDGDTDKDGLATNKLNECSNVSEFITKYMKSGIVTNNTSSTVKEISKKGIIPVVVTKEFTKCTLELLP